MDELVAYQTYSVKSEADEVAEKLRKAGIITQVVNKETLLDDVLIGSNYADGYILRIYAANFLKANSILYDSNAISLETISPDHPLYAMDNDELKDIVAKPDEWGADNYNIAIALLKSRGITISDEIIAGMKEERIAVLSEKKRMSPAILLIGYFTALSPLFRNILSPHDHIGMGSLPPTYFVWYFPGAAGILLGIFILSSKTTLPDGTRVRTYDNATIKQGITIFILNFLSWAINIIMVLYKVL